MDDTDPKVIGKLCSALSNSARILNKDHAYILWGVSDDGRIIGTNFNPNDENITKGCFQSFVVILQTKSNIV
jgi:predicted HTH transcriptional regulator